jgi:acetyl-CoA acetyltransferase
VSNPDAVTRLVGLTGIPFIDVFNACATAASAIQLCADTIRLGKYDIGIAVGLDKHPRGAFTDDPAKLALPGWYAENGQFVTTKFFGMKANRYLHDHGISQETLARVAAKNFRNGAMNPNAFRRKPIAEEDILNSPVLNYPLTQYMFCAPDEGAAAVIMCRAEIAQRFTPKPVYVRAVEIRTRRYGSYEVHATSAPVEEDVSPTVYAARAAFEVAGVAPEDVDVIQLQDTDAGAEVIHMAETGFCADGDQEKLVADGATEIGGPMPVNTDGGLIANGEPIGASGLRQMHELVRQLRGEAGDRQVPGAPQVGFAQVYGAPGTASATIVTT